MKCAVVDIRKALKLKTQLEIMYALVDCNNFYCSCERVFNPKLEGRPVIVLSNNDGCAISRSDEAKALGIGMAAPAFIMSKFIDQHQVAVFSSNYTLYGDMSQRIMDSLALFAPKIEIVFDRRSVSRPQRTEADRSPAAWVQHPKDHQKKYWHSGFRRYWCHENTGEDGQPSR